MAVPAILAGATAGAGLLNSILGFGQSIKQKKEAKQLKDRANTQKRARDAKLDEVEAQAAQRAGATKAPGMDEAQELLERNTAGAINNVTRNTTSSANALNAASMINQQKNQAALNLAGKNKQYIDRAQENLQGVKTQRAGVTDADRRESLGRSDAFAMAGDQNLVNAVNAPLTTAMVLGQMDGTQDLFSGIQGLFGPKGPSQAQTDNASLRLQNAKLNAANVLG